MNGNFTEVKQVIWLLWMELVKEVSDANGKEICTYTTLWNLLYEMSAPYYVLLFVCLLLVTLGKY
jgi:hypothetical protein